MEIVPNMRLSLAAELDVHIRAALRELNHPSAPLLRSSALPPIVWSEAADAERHGDVTTGIAP